VLKQPQKQGQYLAQGWINRHFGSLNADEFKILYKIYVRPHMEFCIQAWSPYLQKDIRCLEKIQRRTTKMDHGLKNIAYDDRLGILGLLSLEKRRLRGDLIEVGPIQDIEWSGEYRQASVIHSFIMQSSERTQLKIVEAAIKSTSTSEFLQPESDWWVEQAAKWYCYVNFSQHV